MEYLVICYISSASSQFREVSLGGILSGSRIRNENRGITGVLLHSHGSFMQIMEGAPDAVETLFDKVSKDPRHCGVQVLLKRHTHERYFGDWSLAFREMSEEERRSMGAYADLLAERPREDNEGYAELLPDWIQSLVKEFRRINR